MKKWILKTFFKKDMDQLFKDASIDAFTKAVADLEETSDFKTEERAKELSERTLNDMLSPVDLRKIVALDKNKGILFIGGEKAEDGRLTNLRSEAEFLLKSELWQLLYETPKELASRAMFVQGETLADMQKGKSILYMLSTQKNILTILSGYIVKKPPTGPGTP